MKAVILQESFAKALGLVSRFVSTKATLPILSNILLLGEKGQIKLSATNLEMGININLGAKIEKEGALTIPAKTLTELISSLPPDKIQIEINKNSLFISSGVFKANLNGTPPEEFPQIPSYSGEPILSFESNELAQALSRVVFAAAQDEGRPVLTGVLLQIKDGKFSLVATDGYRLSFKGLNVKKINLEKNLLIPQRTLLEVARIAQEKGKEGGEIGVAFTPEKSQIVFSLPDIELSSRLLEGEFPDFEKIIPPASSTKAVFDKDEFLRAVKVASIFAREQANIVKLKIDPLVDGGKLIISAETPQVGGNESEISTKAEGEELEIALNCRFLLDFLNSCPAEEIIFEANGPLSPGVFKIKGDDSFLHLIMPVRLQT